MGQKQTKQWSPRSQRSLLERNEAELQLSQQNSLIRTTEKDIAELERLKADQLKRSLERDESVELALSRTVQKLEEKRRVLAAYQEQRASLEARLRELDELTPAAQEARAEAQAGLAELAEERLAKDGEIDAALKALRSLLEERGSLTARLVEQVSAIELTLEEDDAYPFEKLLASLPEEVLSQSQAWAAWFLGERADEKPYIVRDDCLVAPETLAQHGVYCFGETVRLTDAEAAELSRMDRPVGSRQEPWRCRPPSVATPEAHAAAVASAEEAGIAVKDAYVREDLERDRENERRFQQGEPLGAPASGRFQSLEMAAPRMVQVRAKWPIKADRDYQAGETLEVSETSAWSLVRSGSAEFV